MSSIYRNFGGWHPWEFQFNKRGAIIPTGPARANNKGDVTWHFFYWGLHTLQCPGGVTLSSKMILHKFNQRTLKVYITGTGAKRFRKLCLIISVSYLGNSYRYYYYQSSHSLVMRLPTNRTSFLFIVAVKKKLLLHFVFLDLL